MINVLEKVTIEVPEGDWQNVWDITNKFSPDRSSSAVLSLYTGDHKNLISEAVKLTNDQGYAWLLDGKFGRQSFDKLLLEDLILFYFVLKGEHIQVLPNIGQIHQSGVRLNILHVNQACKQVRIFDSNTEYQYIALGLKPEVFTKQWGLSIDDLELENIVINGNELPQIKFFELKKDIKRICYEIFSARSTIDTEFRYNYLQAKFCELMCLTLTHIKQADFLPYNKTSLGNIDLKKLASCKRLIENDVATIPTLDELAIKVQISRKKLAYGFKMIYGYSIYQYYQKIKLEKAKQHIQQGKLSMIIIAEAAGYQSQAAFTRAYKKHFGHSPKFDKS